MKRTSEKIIDLKKKKNELNFKKLIKFMKIPLVALVVLVALFLSIRLMGNVAVSNVTDGLRQVKTIFSSSAGYPYSLENKELGKLETVGGDVVIVSEKNLSVLDSRARLRLGTQLDSADSKIIGKNGRTLVYSNTSPVISLLSKTEVLGSVTEQSPVVTADLAENGSFACSNSSEKAQSVLTVYNNRFNVEFRWNCSGERISAIGLSSNGKIVAAAAVGTKNAEIYSRFLIFDTDETNPVADITYSGTFIYRIIYTNGNRIIAVGDNKTLVYNAKGEKLEEFTYTAESVSAICNDDNGNTVICLSEFGGAKTRIVVYKSNGKRSAEVIVNGAPGGIDIADNRIAVILGNDIVKLSYSGKELDRISANGSPVRVAVTSGSVYTVESGSICKY